MKRIRQETFEKLDYWTTGMPRMIVAGRDMTANHIEALTDELAAIDEFLSAHPD